MISKWKWLQLRLLNYLSMSLKLNHFSTHPHLDNHKSNWIFHGSNTTALTGKLVEQYGSIFYLSLMFTSFTSNCQFAWVLAFFRGDSSTITSPPCYLMGFKIYMTWKVLYVMQEILWLSIKYHLKIGFPFNLLIAADS